MAMVEIIILILATWRISSLLVNEDGPADYLAELRAWLGVRYDERNNAYGTNVIAGVLACMWCCSVWVGLVWAGLYWYTPQVAFWVALPLALSAGAIVIERAANG